MSRRSSSGSVKDKVGYHCKDTCFKQVSNHKNYTLQTGSATSLTDALQMKESSGSVSRRSVKDKVGYHCKDTCFVCRNKLLIIRITHYRLAQPLL